MKIAVFSDTHRSIEGAKRIILDECPDYIIHLGDHIKDAYRIQEQFPDIPMECVPGNCDYAPTETETKLIILGGMTIMLTHGHKYRVKYEMTPLLNAAHFQGVDMVLFGHTHRPLNDRVGDLYVVNPGTAGEGAKRTWARIVLDNGAVNEVSILDV